MEELQRELYQLENRCNQLDPATKKDVIRIQDTVRDIQIDTSTVLILCSVLMGLMVLFLALSLAVYMYRTDKLGQKLDRIEAYLDPNGNIEAVKMAQRSKPRFNIPSDYWTAFWIGFLLFNLTVK